MSALVEPPEFAEFRENLYIPQISSLDAATRADLRKTLRIVKDDEGKLTGLTALFFLQSLAHNTTRGGQNSLLMRHDVADNSIFAFSPFSSTVNDATGLQAILSTDDLMPTSQLKYLKHILSTYVHLRAGHFRLTYKTLNGQVQTSIVGLSRQQKKEFYGQL